MTVKEVTRFSLSELKEITVTCKKCEAKMVFPVKAVGEMASLECCRCGVRLGAYANNFYLGAFASELGHLQDNTGIEIEFELSKGQE